MVKRTKYEIDGKLMTLKEVIAYTGNTVNYGTALSRLRNGASIEDALKPVNNPRKRDIKKYTIDNKTMTVKELLAYTGSSVKYATVIQRLASGVSIEEAIKETYVATKQYSYDGKLMTLPEVLEYTGNPVSYSTALHRVNNGMDIKDALKPVKPRTTSLVECGLTPKEIKEAMHLSGTKLNYRTIKGRLKAGETIEEAMKPKKFKQKLIKYQLGSENLTIHEMVEKGYTKLPYYLIVQRLERGISIEEAIKGEQQERVTYIPEQEEKSLRKIYAERKPNITYAGFVYRLKKGYTLEEAFTLGKYAKK